MNGSDAAPPKNAGCSAPRSSNATTSSRSPWRRTSRLAWSSLSSSVEIFKPPCCSAGFAFLAFGAVRPPARTPGLPSRPAPRRLQPGRLAAPVRPRRVPGQGWRGGSQGSRCSIGFAHQVLLCLRARRHDGGSDPLLSGVRHAFALFAIPVATGSIARAAGGRRNPPHHGPDDGDLHPRNVRRVGPGPARVPRSSRFAPKARHGDRGQPGARGLIRRDSLTGIPNPHVRRRAAQGVAPGRAESLHRRSSPPT